MTRFADQIESGNVVLTSADSSRAKVRLVRSRVFTGGGNQTWSGVLPSGAENFDVRLYITQQGSTATSDTFTITTSAGGTTLATITAVGSALGVLRTTTTGLGTLSVIASACADIGPNIDGVQVPFRVILSSLDTATSYKLDLEFCRRYKAGQQF